MALLNSNISNTGLVEKYIGTAYDHVQNVSANMASVVALAEIEDIEGIAAIIAPAVENAENSAAAALLSEQNAAASAVDSANSANTSEAHSLNSATSAQASADSATAALGSEYAAGISAQESANSAAESAVSAVESSEHRGWAYLWASEGEDLAIDDGTRSGYSAYHWAEKAKDASAAGEANTASNLGAGEGFFVGKSIVDLQFKGLAVTGGGTISSDGSTITIDILNNLNHTSLVDATDPDLHPITSITGLQPALDLKAPLASPSLIGNATAPTPSYGDISLKIATTQFVNTSLINKADVSYVDDQFAIAIALG